MLFRSTGDLAEWEESNSMPFLGAVGGSVDRGVIRGRNMTRKWVSSFSSRKIVCLEDSAFHDIQRLPCFLGEEMALCNSWCLCCRNGAKRTLSTAGT